MITRSDIVKADLIKYFAAYQEYRSEQTRVDLIMDDMRGVRSPNLTDVHGTPEDRQSKLIRLGEELKTHEYLRDKWDTEQKSIANRMRLWELDDIEYRMLKMIYLDKLTYAMVAETLGYAGKQVVYVKHDELIKRMSAYL